MMIRLIPKKCSYKIQNNPVYLLYVLSFRNYIKFIYLDIYDNIILFLIKCSLSNITKVGCMENIKKFFISLFTINLTQTLIWGGIFVTFIGALFGDTIDSWTWMKVGTGDALLKIGSAILGAGVFAVIMKSAQFTEVFQKNIMDVLYNPVNLTDKSVLKEKWIFLTNEMLKQVLPKVHYDATNQIEKQFLNSELEYHFENYEVTYDINVDSASNIATTVTTTKASLVLSPNIDNPVFKQVFYSDEKQKLLRLSLNGQREISIALIENPEKEKSQVLTFPLKKYDNRTDKEKDCIIPFERVVQSKQDLGVDPYIAFESGRYTKGMIVKAKISDEHKIHFERFGSGILPPDYHEENDGTEYERWKLAEPEKLLFPGEGFIMVIIKK